MHILQTVLGEKPEVRRAVNALSEGIAENSMLQGLFLDVNPLWWACYRLDRAGIDPDKSLGYLGPIEFEGPWLFTVLDRFSMFGGGVAPKPSFKDFARSYSAAEHLTYRFFGNRQYGSSPFLLKIIAKPNESESDRDALLEVARACPVPTLIETRSIAKLIAGPGDPLTSGGTTGTLGGFLRDGSGTIYAATCGHVISRRARATVNGVNLGICTHSSPPVALPTGSTCHVHCATKATQDLALVDVGGATVANTCTSVASYVYSHQLVNMHGATSGLMHYEVGGVGVTHEVGGACWEGVFELRLQSHPSVLHPNLALLATSPPQSGDSGAWVTDGTEWCGVVTAADTTTGYALPADQVQSEARAAWGIGLSLA